MIKPTSEPDDAVEHAATIYREAVRFASGIDADVKHLTDETLELTPVAFTAVAIEVMFILVHLADRALFELAGPDARAPWLDRLESCLNYLMQDEGLTTNTKFLTNRELEPGIRLSGFDYEELDRRSAEFADAERSLGSSGLVRQFVNAAIRPLSGAIDEQDIFESAFRRLTTAIKQASIG